MTNLFSYLGTIRTPTNVKAKVLRPRRVVVTWTVSSSPNVTGYIISYTTTASYTSGGRKRVNQYTTTRGTLNNLEESTTYTITVQAITNDNRMSGNSNAVSVTTYTDGKQYMISCQRITCYNSTVPSSPTQNVIVTSVNPASLMVSWQPPPKIHHNGPITYIINYTRIGSSDMISVNVNSGTTHTISGLVAYVDYSVIVAARTVNGYGPFSNPVVQRSGEDSEFNR